MAVFNYTALDQEGNKREGTIDAVSVDLAISALQRRGLIVTSVDPVKEGGTGLNRNITFLERITGSDIVMLSRQMTTLFEAQVSALRAFRLLATEARTKKLADVLTEIGNDVQSGSTISGALAKHPAVFTDFYVNMVRAGEESGKLDETFAYLADYLDRNYEVTSKVRNALIYPAFIIVTFFGVMALMMTFVIPNLATILTGAGQKVPLYTEIIISISMFMSRYFVLLAILLAVMIVAAIRYVRTPSGYEVFSRTRLQLPVMGMIYQKIFLSRIADNLSTMMKSGVQILRAIEITGSVVGDPVYRDILTMAAADVKGGLQLSDALRKHEEIPGIIVAMIKIGEETGNIAGILDTMARFYRREVNNAVDTMVDLIEPFVIVFLAVGVGILLASVLVPIYNIASSI